MQSLTSPLVRSLSSRANAGQHLETSRGSEMHFETIRLNSTHAEKDLPLLPRSRQTMHPAVKIVSKAKPHRAQQPSCLTLACVIAQGDTTSVWYDRLRWLHKLWRPLLLLGGMQLAPCMTFCLSNELVEKPVEPPEMLVPCQGRSFMKGDGCATQA